MGGPQSSPQAIQCRPLPQANDRYSSRRSRRRRICRIHSCDNIPAVAPCRHPRRSGESSSRRVAIAETSPCVRGGENCWAPVRDRPGTARCDDETPIHRLARGRCRLLLPRRFREPLPRRRGSPGSPGERWDGVQEETSVRAKDSRHSFFGARILFFPHLLGKPLQTGLGDYFVPSLKNRYPSRAGFPPE